MKYFLPVIFCWLLLACRKESDKIQLPRDYALPVIPEALAAFDSSNYGIYKGVVINAQDSTATFKFNLYNNSAQPYALFYKNNKIHDSLIRYRSGPAGMVFPQTRDTAQIPHNATFYYTYFSSYRIGKDPIIGFNTSAYGKTYLMDAVLYNNATLNAILKEKSSRQVYCYEGSYSGVDSGRIAIVMTTDTIVAIRASIWNPQFFKVMTSTVSGNSFSITQYDDTSGRTFVFDGSCQNNTCTGTWTRSSNPGVTNSFIARRTL